MPYKNENWDYSGNLMACIKEMCNEEYNGWKDSYWIKQTIVVNYTIKKHKYNISVKLVTYSHHN